MHHVGDILELQILMNIFRLMGVCIPRFSVLELEMEVRNVKRFIYILLLLFFISSAYGATIYKWVDKEGVVNFTDDINKVPLSYRDRVEVEIREDVQKPGTPVPPQAPLQKREELRADIYGRDETWWKEKVQPWKERLKEATANYERVHSKFMEKAEELSVRRYGSPTQYKTNIRDLDRLKEEMMKYEAQIAEANEMLKKLSKEAEESKANPDWLK